MRTSVLSLQGGEALAAESFGNKASALSRLAGGGIDVPAGFAIGWELLDGVFHEPRTIAPAQRAQRRPDDFSLSIASALAELDLLRGQEVIVRSSAVCEDIAGASYAGLFQSTRVHGSIDTIMDTILEVYNSQYAAHIRIYSERLVERGFRRATAPIRMAVIVQKYVPCLVGGVLFMCDPMGGPGQRVEIASGGAESVVAGVGTEVSAHYLGTPESLPAEAWQEVVQLAGTEEAATELIRALDKKSRRASELLGGPQDIEWGWTGNTLWIFQSRALASTPEPETCL